MKARIDFLKTSFAAIKAMYGLETYLNKCGLEKSLLELVKVRVSQINGCAFCLNMHFNDALKAGERQRRLDLIGVWREIPLFTPREGAALAWAEAVTCISQGGVSDQLYAQAREQFSEEELINLNLAVVAINGWNRFSISFQLPPELGDNPH